MTEQPVRYIALAFAIAQAVIGVLVAAYQDSALTAALAILSAVLTQAAAEISRTKVTPMAKVRHLAPVVARDIERGAPR